MQLNGLSLAITNVLGGRLNPLSWFAAGEQGAWYDPSDLTTLFQDSAGTTPMSAVGTVADQPVGLMRDKSGRGNHAFQATAGNRPMLSARVNLLTKTEDFSDAVWGKAGVTATSDSITSTGSIAYAYKNLGVNLPATAYSLSCKVKVGTNNFVALNIQGISSYWATIVFNLDPLNPSVGQATVGAGVGVTITNPSISLNSDGYLTISAVVTCTTSVLRYFGIMLAPLATGNTLSTAYGEISGNTAGQSVFFKQADIRPTNAGALLPAYQRVNTASDYDTVGFPLYLKANGTSSAMSTNSIDFSSTDKMTVVTGVRKLSDATRGMIGELSSSLDTNNGSFNISGSFPNATANYRYESKGTLVSSADCGTGYIAPINNVLTTQSYIATDSDSMRVNGTLVATSPADQGAGNFGNYPFYLFARAGTSLFLNGQFYGAIIRGAQSDTASITQTENYMATKTGITF